ncbi:MAG TPA: hypothetical protein VM324_00250 [Egibacteraceae bacterium]|nr:hypothetical protein [Egibacteraceae bacterium]
MLTGVLAVRAAALAGIAGLVVAGAPPAIVYAIAAADALAFRLHWPFHSALQPELGGHTRGADAANATTTTVENLGTLLGPASAAVLLAAAAVPAVFVALAVLLVAAATVVHGVDPIQPVRSVTRPRDVLAGFAARLGAPAPRLVAGLCLAYTLCLGAVPVPVVVTAIDLLAMGEPGVGSLQAAVGAGGLVALSGRLRSLDATGW